jgi:WD40 repeat protein
MNPLLLTLEFSRKERVQDRFLTFPRAAVDYRLRLGEGEYRDASFPWSLELHSQLEALQGENPGAELIHSLGDLLRDFLGETWNVHELSIQRALEEGREVHLTFLSSADELYALPWELLRFTRGRKHLAAHKGCFLRYVWRDAQDAHSSGEHDRILFAWSMAGGYVPLEGHVAALEAACRPGEVSFNPTDDLIGHISLSRLEAALKHAKRPAAVLHILCHGVRLEGGGYGLLWESSSQEGATEIVTGDRLADVLEPYAHNLRMVVLCACQSGDPGVPGSHTGSVAQALHQRGIPAVIASRWPLSLSASVTLAEVLYRELFQRPASLQRALAAARWWLRRKYTSLDWATLQLYASKQIGVDFRPIHLRPYRGLLAFEERQRRFFCGRGPLSRQLRRRVRQAVEGEGPRFLVVAGASGSGKSSLVMAGLVPALTNSGWEFQKIRPGDLHVAAELERLLHQRFKPTQRLLLLVDQFEELFTRVAEEKREGLVKALWALSCRKDACIVVVATIRVDFFERAGEVLVAEGLRLDAIFYDEWHRLFVPQLASAQYKEIISVPARRTGLVFEKGLVETLLNDVGEGAGALPLLEYALDQLWQRREGNHLTHDAYTQMGHVTGALAQRVEALYTTLSETEKSLARRLLLELIDIRNDSAPFTRRRTKLADLPLGEAESLSAFTSVVEKFLAERILVQSAAGLEIAHESLIRHWPRLTEWVLEDQERLLQIRDLRNMAEAWHVGRGALLTGDSLGYALEVQKKFGSALGHKINHFIERSHVAFEEQRRQQENQLRREREQFERLRNHVRLTMAARLADHDPTLALLVLREIKTDLGTAWTQPVLDVLQKPISSAILPGPQGINVATAFSPDGSRILTAASDGTIRLWPASGSGPAVVLKGRQENIRVATFNPSGSHVLTASADGTALVWPADGSGEPVELSGHQGEIHIASFSPDGSSILTASADLTVRIWPFNRPGEVTCALRHPRPIVAATFGPDGQYVLTAFSNGLIGFTSLVRSGFPTSFMQDAAPLVTAALSPDGSRLLTASYAGTPRIWLLDGSITPVALQGFGGIFVAAAFSSDSSRILIVSSDRTVRVWPASGSGDPVVLQGHRDSITAATFSPDGSRILTASGDGTARLWPIDGSSPPVIFQGHQGIIVSAAFSPDGSHILTASSDGTVRVWPIAGLRVPTVLKAHQDSIVAAVFSPAGGRVLTASADHTARLWSADSGTPIAYREHESRLMAAAFSPDGTRVLTASAKGTIHLWRASPRVSIEKSFQAHSGPIFTVSFSPDGLRILSASQDGTARVWSVDGAWQPIPLIGHQGPIYAATFSPDGSCILTVSEDGTARLWRFNDSPHPRILAQQQYPFWTAAFSPDGSHCALGSEDGSVYICRTNGSRSSVILKGHQGTIYATTFSPDGTLLLTASHDRTARIWRANGRDSPIVLQGHLGSISAAAFSPKGSRVLTASSDCTARVWPTDNSGPPVILQGHMGPVLTATFSPDGTRVLTASVDGTARIWPLHFQLLQQHLGTVTSARLTPEQRQHYLHESPEEAQQNGSHGRGR